jgi:predicted nucleic acid-binding protein
MIFVDTSFFIALLDPRDKLEILEALTLDGDFGHRFVMRPAPTK